jgi:hypothetical protein
VAFDLVQLVAVYPTRGMGADRFEGTDDIELLPAMETR